MHPAVVRRLARLAPDQRAAATAPPGPVLCVAPAGSGKTTTLVARVAWRFSSGTDPARMCTLTFNKRAADELGDRLAIALAEIGGEDAAIRVRTFHALGREILDDAGVDVTRLVDRATVLSELYRRPVVGAELRRLDDAFSRLTLDPERGPDEEQLRSAHATYRAALTGHRALDFDDLVAGALDRLRQDTRLLGRWRQRCRTLFVDEAQDLDRSQLDLALLLTGDRRDVFLVGDDDQTIYAWRLADVRRILGLAAALPGLRRVDLETNYRCPAPVVRRSVRLIEHGVERFAKRIVPSQAGGELALLADPGDPVCRARRLLSAWYGRSEGTYAVLARTNAELAPYASLALERGIAYHAAEDGLLLDDPAIDPLLERALLDARSSNDGPWLAALSRSLATAAGNGPHAAAARALLGWAAAVSSLPALGEAVREARRRRASLRTADARLNLATVHAAKGLEFDHVAVVGLDEGTFPSSRSVAEAPDPRRALDEERRLAYVAWTRARRSLLLVYDPGSPSAFMLEAFDHHELAA